jgi:transposase-like protein
MTARHASSLRAALASHEPGRGRRYSPDLKARIIEFAQSRRGEGASWAEIAGEIGIGFETLAGWCMAAEPKTRAMVPVRVVPDRDEVTVSVVSAGGHRIEGLTLPEAIAVLRALG